MARRNHLLTRYARRSPGVLDSHSALGRGGLTIAHYAGPPPHADALAAEIADVIRKAFRHLPNAAAAVQQRLGNLFLYGSAEALMDLTGDLYDRLAKVGENGPPDDLVEQIAVANLRAEAQWLGRQEWLAPRVAKLLKRAG